MAPERARTLLAVAALAVLALAAAAQEPSGGGTVLVHLADGSSLPLRSWSFSYEYATWKRGQSPAFASFEHKESHELWVGKKSYATAGAVLEIAYTEEERERDEGGEIQKVKVAVASGMTLTGPDGKQVALKVETPRREALAPEADKEAVVQPRSLDLLGETVMGTRSSFCLLSYSVLVECGLTPGQRVVRIEFQK